jgi:long-subunit fatty acid transport protein
MSIRAKDMNDLKQRGKQFLGWMLLASFIVSFTACVTNDPNKKYYFGITYEVRGKTRIHDLVITFASHRITGCIKSCVPGAGSYSGTSAQIPETVTISWKTEDEAQQQVSIEVRSKISDFNRFAAIEFEIHDKTLVARQELRPIIKGQVGLERQPLYP